MRTEVPLNTFVNQPGPGSLENQSDQLSLPADAHFLADRLQLKPNGLVGCCSAQRPRADHATSVRSI